MMDRNKTVVIVILSIIVICGVIIVYLINYKQYPTAQTNSTSYDLNIKIFDKTGSLDGKYKIFNDKQLLKSGDLKKGLLAQESLPNLTLYTVILSSSNHYSDKINIAQDQYHLLEKELTPIGDLNISYTGTIKDNNLVLNIQSIGEIRKLSYCIGTSTNIYNVYPINNYESCPFNWVNYQINDSYNNKIIYYTKGVYRCPYSIISINNESEYDKKQFCDGINNNLCYRGSVPIPNKYQNDAIKCFDTNQNLKDTNLVIPLNVVTGTLDLNDKISFFWYDNDLNDNFEYVLGNYEKETLINQ